MKIDSKILDEIAADIRCSLLDHYEYDSQSSDYVCVFCGNRAEKNNVPVVHKDDCLGVRFLKAYDEADKDEKKLPAFVLLRGIKEGNIFFTTNDGTDPTKLLDGTVAYEVIGYADTVADAQIKLYGRSFV